MLFLGLVLLVFAWLITVICISFSKCPACGFRLSFYHTGERERAAALPQRYTYLKCARSRCGHEQAFVYEDTLLL
jgi:hypothetical protein